MERMKTKVNKKVFLSLSCLSEKRISKAELYNLFDKKCDQRYLEVAVRKFKLYNRRTLEFLGIGKDDVYFIDSGEKLTLCFSTENSRYIGAIPVKMPYDNISHSDLQLLPRKDLNDINSNTADVMSNIFLIVQEIEGFSDTIVEFLDNTPLVFPNGFKPPMYYEAAKYIELFCKAQNACWHKFKKEMRIRSYPKASTNWNEYALNSYNPQKRLQYVCNDNILSQNHREWQELKYVYQLAKNEILNNSTPRSIYAKNINTIRYIDQKIGNISLTQTNSCKINITDPLIIKQLKTQANIILKQNYSIHNAWRIDIAELFERFAQYIFSKALSRLGGKIIANDKIKRNGTSHYNWTMTGLEPDITIQLNDKIIFADAKYKRNLYNNLNSKILKETHRHDFHQILAYCSFSPQANSVGMLIYPFNITKYEKLYYNNRITSISNELYLIGIPFEYSKINDTITKIKELFQNEFLGGKTNDN